MGDKTDGNSHLVSPIFEEWHQISLSTDVPSKMVRSRSLNSIIPSFQIIIKPSLKGAVKILYSLEANCFAIRAPRMCPESRLVVPFQDQLKMEKHYLHRVSSILHVDISSMS